MRHRRLLLTFVLAVAAIGLATGLLRTPPDPLDGAPALLPEPITRITIQAGDATPLRLEHRSEGWWLTSPVELPAHEPLLRPLLRLAAAPPLDRFTTTASLATYGIEATTLHAEFNATRLQFGAPAPLADGRYAALGESIVVLSEELYRLLSLPPVHFINPRPLAALTPLQRLDLPGERLTLQDDGWHADPAQDNADALAERIEAWRHLHASRVVLEPTDAPASAETVTATAADGRQRRFTLLTRDPLQLLDVAQGVRYDVSNASPTLFREP